MRYILTGLVLALATITALPHAAGTPTATTYNDVADLLDEAAAAVASGEDSHHIVERLKARANLLRTTD